MNIVMPWLIPVIAMGLTGLACYGISRIRFKSFEETMENNKENPR